MKLQATQVDTLRNDTKRAEDNLELLNYLALPLHQLRIPRLRLNDFHVEIAGAYIDCKSNSSFFLSTIPS